jgi:hypothetical protein
MNSENIENLENIKTYIENLSKFHQVEILKILSKNLCKINENKSGVYVNLSFLSNETLQEIKYYIEYIKKQEDSINTTEYQKEEFKNAFFIDKEKDNKDEMPSIYNTISKCIEVVLDLILAFQQQRKLLKREH